MAEPPFESARPPDEAWWERELNRNEKLIDKYMAALGDEPDWDKWQNPEDLYNKVHYDIDPPARPAGTGDNERPETPGELKELSEEEQREAESKDSAFIDSMNAADDLEALNDDALENEPPDNEDYPVIARLAREFAVGVLQFEEIPEDADVLYLSAGKVGANLAGGHGLGYDDDGICGNIVKCRWALADCEFCREMLGHLHQRSGRAELGDLQSRAQEVSAAIRDRIARLRARVWW